MRKKYLLIIVIVIVVILNTFLLMKPKYLFNDKNNFSYYELNESVNLKDKLIEKYPSYGFKTIEKNNKVTIEEVLPNSQAQKSGLQKGDVIKKVNDINILITNKNERKKLDKIMISRSPGKITLTIERNNALKNIILIPDKKLLHEYKIAQITLYPDSIKMKNNYALGWFKVYKNSPLQIVHVINPQKWDFNYTKEMYICDCEHNKAALAYMEIYSNNNNKLDIKKYYKDKNFKLEENKDRLKFFQYWTCLYYQK